MRLVFDFVVFVWTFSDGLNLFCTIAVCFFFLLGFYNLIDYVDGKVLIMRWVRFVLLFFFILC